MWYPLPAQLAQVEAPAGINQSILLFIGAGVGGLILLLMLFKLFFGRSNKAYAPRQRLREDLAEYPPAPAGYEPSISFDGIPVRVRLIVVCPTGAAGDRIQTDDVGELLDEILYGLSSVLETDKPRVKVWPPQLSVNGFAPTFHREVKSPDLEGSKSRWILVAGPTRAAGKPVLLGLALYAKFPVKMGQLTLQGREWQQTLKVER